MKKITSTFPGYFGLQFSQWAKLIVAIIAITVHLPVMGQVKKITFNDVKKIADHYANEFYGDVYPDTPTPYYGPNDEIIAYQFNYSIGRKFPGKEKLMEECNKAFEKGNRDEGWGDENYANMVFGANSRMPVFIEGSKGLSKQYALGIKLKQTALEELGEEFFLDKTYYFGMAEVWFCFAKGNIKKYIKLEPYITILDETAYKEHIQKINYFWQRDNFDEDWTKFLKYKDPVKSGTVFIPGSETQFIPYLSWSYGCTPTAAAMLMAWWDNYHDFSNLVKYYMDRWDPIQNQTDYHVPKTQKALASWMGTDSEGETMRYNICDGMQDFVQSRGYSCSTDSHYAFYWSVETLFDDVKGEINGNKPLLVSISHHTITGVGYNNNNKTVYVHDPNYPSLRYITRSQLEGTYWITISNNYSIIGELDSPHGGLGWQSNGAGGETLKSNDFYEIKWTSINDTSTYTKLYYSDEGGTYPEHWFPISEYTENDGSYIWHVPEINNGTGDSTYNARVKIEIYDQSNQMLAGDGSYGDFSIFPGGSLQELSTTVLTQSNPDFFSINMVNPNWSAVGVRDYEHSAWWYLRLFDDTEFSNVLEESTNWDMVNYIVLNGHNIPPSEYGIKAFSFDNNTEAACIKFDNDTCTLSAGTADTNSWNCVCPIKIWDIHLTPGSYYFKLDVDSTSALDLDMALFKSGGDNIFARQGSVASSSNIGMGIDESFHYQVNFEGDYGLCINSNNNELGTYVFSIVTPGEWVGTVSSDWHDPANWTSNSVPTHSDDVVIPSGCSNYPSVQNETAYSKNVTVEEGASLTINNKYMNVYGDLQVFGELIMEGPNSELTVENSITWESGSSIDISDDNALITCYRSWAFKSGSSVQIQNGMVRFVSSIESSILSNSSNSYFNDVIIEKTDENLKYNLLSTKNLHIAGNLTINSGSTFISDCEGSILLGGSLINQGHFMFDNGTFELVDNSISIDCNTGDYFNNLRIASTSACVLSNDLHLNGDLIIDSGGLFTLSNNIYIGGSWHNNMGPEYFAEGLGAVIFSDQNVSYCYGEEFNTLELLSGELNFPSGTTTCELLKQTGGALNFSGGVFTANDLYASSGIKGEITMSAGEVNFHQDAGAQMYIGAEMYITGGTMNIYKGGGDISCWACGEPAGIYMEDGVIDFKGLGIKIGDYFDLYTEITGGVIRCTGNLNCERTDFNPEGGTFELYGQDPATVSCEPQSHFNNVIINKVGSKNNSTPKTEKSKLQPKAMTTVTTSLISDLSINGNLTISSGSLDINGHILEVGNDLIVDDMLVMHEQSDLVNVHGSVGWGQFSASDVIDGEILVEGDFSIESGANVQFGNNHTLKFLGNEISEITNNATGTSLGNFQFNKTDKRTIINASSQAITVNGDMLVFPDNEVRLSGAVLDCIGTFYGDDSCNVIIEDNAALNVNSAFSLDGSFVIGSGSVDCNGQVQINTAALVEINGGSFIWSRPYSASYFNIYGDVALNDGTFEVTNDGISMGPLANLIMYNGVVNIGWGIIAQHQNNFIAYGGKVVMTGENNGAILFDENNHLYNLEINKNSTAIITAANDLTVNHDITVLSGQLNVLSNTLTVNGDVYINPGGYLQLTDGNIEVGGNWDNSGGDLSFIEGTGRVTFIGNEESSILGNESFYNLEIDKTGSDNTYVNVNSGLIINILHNLTITNRSLGLHDNVILNVDGDITISDDGCLLSASSVPVNINVGGNWLNHNTSGSPVTYGFYPGMSIVKFNGTEDQYVDADQQEQVFHDLVIDKTTNSFFPLTDISVEGNLDIENGTWGNDDPNHNYSFYGDIGIGSSGLFDDNTCNMNIRGSGLQHLGVAGTTPVNIGSLNLRMAGTGNKSSCSFIIQGELHCHESIIVDTGTFIVNSQTIECGELFTINENGRVLADRASTIAMGDGAVLTIDGGFLQMLEKDNYSPKLTHITGNYEFSVMNNGTLSASNAIFEYMDANGVNIYPTGLLYSSNSLSNCTFQNGASGGTLLQINNDQDLVINGADLPDNTWGGANNVTKTSDQGSIAFSNVTGNFAGTAFENDPYNRIDWGVMVAGIWTGAVSDVWNDPANWQNSLKPGMSDDVYIPAGTPNDPVISTATQKCKSLTVENGAILEIYNQSLIVFDDIILFGDLRMKQPNSKLYAGDGAGDVISWESGSGCDITLGTIYVAGDWDFKGGTTAQLGFGNTVIFNGDDNSRIYCNDDDATFGTLNIDKPTVPHDYVIVASKNALRVTEDLYVYDGRLDVKEGCDVVVGNDFYVDNGATFNIIGTSGLPSSFSGDADYCLFEVASGGSISADHTVFEHIGSSGILVNAGATVNSSYPFSNCTFKESPAGGILLTIANSQNLTIDGAVFPYNTWSGSYNVSKPNDAGAITFTNVEGGFVSENYENDPYSRVDWPGVVAGIWEGTVSQEWNDSANWKYYLKPTASDDVTIPASAPNQPKIEDADQECRDIVIESGAYLAFRSKALTVHGDIIIYGRIYMLHAGDILNAGDDPGDVVAWRAGSVANICCGSINVFGSWYFYDGTDASFGNNNTTTFYGNNFSTIYNYDDNASFGKLIINKSSAPHDVVTLNGGQSLKVNDGLTISDGVLSLSGNSVLQVNNSIYIDDGATLSCIGTSTGNASITGGTGYCTFEVAAGGTISASYTVFNKMESQGVVVDYDAIIDTLHPFNNCTFMNGRAGGALLTLNNEQFITIDSVSFPENTWNGTYNVVKNQNGGQVTFTNFNGTFAGEWYERDIYNRIEWSVPPYWVHIKVFLEGPFNGSNMNYGMAGIPLTQPYNTPPWNYDGDESVPQIPDNVVDWVLVELRNAADSASATSDRLLEKRVAFLKDDGTITDLGGVLDLQFDKYISQQLYVVVRHRNHLDVMSAFPLQKTGNTFSYDFTPEKNKAYGSINGHKQLIPGVWGMRSGDGNADGIIDVQDKTLWINSCGTSGYQMTDFNLDDQVNNKDKNDKWVPNLGTSSQVPQ